MIGDSSQVEGLVSVAEASRLLALSRSKLYELMVSGQLRYAKFGRARRIPRQALAELAARSMRGVSTLEVSTSHSDHRTRGAKQVTRSKHARGIVP
jgi:excisionase family DNA binding protein